MQSFKQAAAFPDWRRTSPRVLYVIGFAFVYLLSMAICAPQASAAALSGPGGNVSDPVVRQVDIARPAVVRIITKIGARLTVHFAPTSVVATFPLGGGSYNIELSGSGAFISAHGDLLTADHVVNPPHDRGLDDALYQTAAQDIADYVNSHFQSNQPWTSDEVVAELETGNFPSTSSYAQPSSEVYLSTAYTGALSGSRIEDLPTSDHATVDRIEAQSSFDAQDVAIIHVTGMDDMPSIQLDDSSQVQEQDNLTLIGYPGNGDVSNSPTNLLTSSINKIYVSAIKTTDAGAPVIQVGGNVEHGDSGAPVLDASGHIVGIVSFGLATPNDMGETAFLQTSNSARTLIQSQGINTAPGPFEKAWTQAFDDYSSPAPGHWHRAFQELQSLANTYKNFLGIGRYLSYAQDQASQEQASTSSTGSNPLPIVLLVLLLLIILGAVLFVVLRRRGRTAPAVAGIAHYPSAAFGAYQQQPGMPGVYPSTRANYSAPAYQQPAQGGSSGAYQSTSSGFDTPSYPPASYTAPGWYEHSASQAPQAFVPETPLPAALDATAQTPEQNATVSEQPASAPLPEEPARVEQPANLYEQSLPTWTPPAPTPQFFPRERTERAALERATPPRQSGERASAFAQANQDEAPSEAQALSIAGSLVPSNEPWPATPQEEKTSLAPFPTPGRSFSVPRRPSAIAATSSENGHVESTSGQYTRVAPCGHANTPDVRFCRVCGQPISAPGGQDATERSAR
jgi:S1-C subfamily serine protease